VGRIRKGTIEAKAEFCHDDSGLIDYTLTVIGFASVCEVVRQYGGYGQTMAELLSRADAQIARAKNAAGKFGGPITLEREDGKLPDHTASLNRQSRGSADAIVEALGQSSDKEPNREQRPSGVSENAWQNYQSAQQLVPNFDKKRGDVTKAAREVAKAKGMDE